VAAIDYLVRPHAKGCGLGTTPRIAGPVHALREIHAGLGEKNHNLIILSRLRRVMATQDSLDQYTGNDRVKARYEVLLVS
jgi:hypothetical protein